ncbi:hypothetical protein L209DRAFT_82509 [Thermothelomyces heterothallicus CBS 203.75]
MPHQSLMLLLALGDLGDSIRSFLFDTEFFVQRSVLFNGVFCSTECFVQRSVLFNGVFCSTECFVQRSVLFNGVFCSTEPFHCRGTQHGMQAVPRMQVPSAVAALWVFWSLPDLGTAFSCCSH